jgi:hypothetical protein
VNASSDDDRIRAELKAELRAEVRAELLAERKADQERANELASEFSARWRDRYDEIDRAAEAMGAGTYETLFETWAVQHADDEDADTRFERLNLLIELLLGGGPVDIATLEAEWARRHPSG